MSSVIKVSSFPHIFPMTPHDTYTPTVGLSLDLFNNWLRIKKKKKKKSLRNNKAPKYKCVTLSAPVLLPVNTQYININYALNLNVLTKLLLLLKRKRVLF